MTTLLKDDFYDYVNGDWLESAVIPADKPATGGFQDLVDGIEQLMMAEFKNMAADPLATPKGKMKDAVAFYRLASDFTTRDESAGQEVLPILAKIEALASYDELNAQLPAFILDGIQLPFAFDIECREKGVNILELDVGP